MKLNLTPCELFTLARAALAKVEPLKGRRQLLLSGAEEPVTVLADAELMARVFQNLLGNALKFTPDEGRVTVSIEPNQEAVRFLVQDTGPGIPPEYRETIFEKFGQVENSAYMQRYSTGLGLTSNSPVGLPVNPGHTIMSDHWAVPPGAVLCSGVKLHGGLSSRGYHDRAIHGVERPVCWSAAAVVLAEDRRRGLGHARGVTAQPYAMGGTYLEGIKELCR